MRQAAAEQELDGPLIDYAAKGTKVALEGVEAIDGRNAYKLALSFKNGQARHVWIDAQSFLEVRLDGTRRLDGRQRPMYTALGDYKSVDGLMIPHRMETSVDGVPGSEKILVDKI